MTRYTKRVREEAALICAIAASTPDLHQAYGAVVRSMFGRKARTYGRPSFELAISAWNMCQSSCGDEDGTVDAESHALLENGWSPP